MKAVHKRVPALIKGYLRAGAQICGTPALDKVFKTIDFFYTIRHSRYRIQIWKTFSRLNNSPEHLDGSSGVLLVSF